MNSGHVRGTIVVGLIIGLLGCQAHVPQAEAETVGQLAPSYHGIASAPIHHDAPPELGEVVSTDSDDVGASVTTTVRAADAGGDAALPEVAPKTDGVTAGAVR